MSIFEALINPFILLSQADKIIKQYSFISLMELIVTDVTCQKILKRSKRENTGKGKKTE